MNIYDYKLLDGARKEVSMDKYKGKVLLIINSATECGFTPQYDDIQALYAKYEDNGLVVLDFPCNQFGNQSPGTNEEIKAVCSLRFDITFPIFDKIDVNGENQAPLFEYLKSQQAFDKDYKFPAQLDELFKKMNPNYKESSDIKWNFTKFLVDKEGNVVNRFEPTDDLRIVEEKIKNIL